MIKFTFVLPLPLGSAVPVVLAQMPGTFTSTGSLTTPRYLRTATLLNNGKVLMAEGLGPVFGCRSQAPTCTILVPPSIAMQVGIGDGFRDVRYAALTDRGLNENPGPTRRVAGAFESQFLNGYGGEDKR